MTNTPQEVIKFWFEELTPKDWFMGGTAVDEKLRKRFLPLLEEVTSGVHDDWQDTLEGRLALILICDQFSRNIFRGEAKSFGLDQKARELVEFALHNFEPGFDDGLSEPQKLFFYMPLMHSENLEHQELSLSIFSKMGNEASIKEAQKHYDLIQRFGRFPHRNGVLDRESTQDEKAYLEDPNTSNYGVEKQKKS